MKPSKNLFKTLYRSNFDLWLKDQKVQCQDIQVNRAASDTYFTASLLQPGHQNGQVVVVLHSTGCDRFMPLVKLYSELLTSGYKVICLDLDGHGKGSSTVFDSRELLQGTPHHILDDLMHSDFANQLKGGFHLLGQSLGGCSIIDFMTQSDHVNLVKTISLVGMPVYLHFKDISLLKEGYDLVSPTLWKNVLTYGLPGVIPAPGKIRRKQFPIRVRSGRKPIDEILKYINGLNIKEKILRIEVPVLNIIGSLDSIAQGQPNECQSDYIRLANMRGETHYSLLYSERYFEPLLQFLNQP